MRGSIFLMVPAGLTLVFFLWEGFAGSPAPAEAAFPGANGKIVFASNREGNVEIYVMNPDGCDQARLTNNHATDDDPAWSADGTKIPS